MSFVNILSLKKNYAFFLFWINLNIMTMSFQWELRTNGNEIEAQREKVKRIKNSLPQFSQIYSINLSG